MKLLKPVYFIALLIAMICLFNSCTSVQIPQEVCTYGQMTCDAGLYVCENYEIPEPICQYFELACLNFTILCESEYGSVAYQTALKNLNIANVKLNEYIAQTNAVGVQD